MSLVPFFRAVATTLARSWFNLVAADVSYKLLTVTVLTPLIAVIFHCVLTLSGEGVLSDIDIVMFFAGPIGWVCLIVFGAIWLAIVALEQVTLLYILAMRSTRRAVSVVSAMRFTFEHVAAVHGVTVRVIAWSLMILTPFLLIAGGVYFWLLGDYDINYYLINKPSEFTTALFAAAILILALLGLLLRVSSSWFLALPLVLFEQLQPHQALTKSKQRVSGHRSRVLVWLMTWGGTVVAVNALMTALIGAVGQVLIPASLGSLPLLATRVGLLILVLAAGGLVVNLFATISVAGLLFCGYQRINSPFVDTISVMPQLGSSGRPMTMLLTRWWFFVFGLCGAFLSAAVGYWFFDSVHVEDEVQVMAHRGSSYVAPENTMAAFRQAIEDGADWIELDVQETLDGEVIVVHDSDFMKLSKNPLKVWNARLEELTKLDIGTWFDPAFTNERVPTLAEVLRLCRDRIKVNIELKYYGHDQQLEQRVVDVVEAEGMADQIMVMSLKPEGIAKMKSLRPSWKCGLLLSVYVGRLQHIQADFLAVNANFATGNFVNRAHKSGKQVFVWTVNDAATMSRMLNRGVDGILTDRPDLVRQVLQQRSELSTAERLLTEISAIFQQPVAMSEP